MQHHLQIRTTAMRFAQIGPNPVVDELVVQTQMGTVKLQLFNATGQLVENREISGRAVVDLRRLAAGAYHLIVGSAEGLVGRFSLMKQ